MGECRGRVNQEVVRLILPILVFTLLSFSIFISADRGLRYGEKLSSYTRINEEIDESTLDKIKNFLWKPTAQSYVHVWPPMQFGWRIIVGTIIAIIGAAFGSVGGVGGGGIFVPMLSLIIGFDAKSAPPISKCMITGAAASTVYYNLKKRHPTLDMPLVDYDLAMLVQPMLMLGISIGVTLSVILADWMVTILLIVMFLGTSSMSFMRGIETWKKETILKKEVAARKKELLNAANNGNEEKNHNSTMPSAPDDNGMESDEFGEAEVLSALGSEGIGPMGGELVAEHLSEQGDALKPKKQVSLIDNIAWKELGILVLVWVAFLLIQIFKIKVKNCSSVYWVLFMLQVPIAVGVTLYQAVGLHKGTKTIKSMGGADKKWTARQLLNCAFLGTLAGTIGGLLGLGGGFLLGPIFLELGVPPQVSSATATFAMVFSAAMGAIEYYLLKRFPVPYAAYFLGWATFAALAGQFIVRKVIKILGRASLIIFILAATIFMSALLLGGNGIKKVVKEISNHDYLGFEDMCPS